MAEKKQRKMLSSYSILLLIILVIGICTWFIPAGQYEKDASGNYIPGTYHTVEKSSQGFWDMFMAPINGMLGTDKTEGAIPVALYVLIIGGFLGVVTRTGAVDVAIASLMTKRKGKEQSLIPILMIIFALGGSTYGMAEETIAFYPLLLPIMVMAGFDTIAAASIILIGAGIGCLASTINPFATGIASQSVGISPGDGIGWRVGMLIVNTFIAIWYVYHYAMKVKKNPQLSIVADQMEENHKYFANNIPKTQMEMTRRQKWVLRVFIFTFVIMIVSLIPWHKLHQNWTFFLTSTKWLQEVPILGTILGAIVPFGDWYFNELSMLFLMSSIIIGFIYVFPEEDFIDAFMVGAKDLLGVALIIGLARGIQVIMDSGQMTATILHWGEMGLKNLSQMWFGIIVYIFYIPMSFLIPSTSGLASATMGIIGPMANFAHVPAHVTVTAFQTASGLVNLITPTSGVVIGALSISRIPFNKWIKFVSLLLGILFVVNLIFIAVMSVMG